MSDTKSVFILYFISIFDVVPIWDFTNTLNFLWSVSSGVKVDILYSLIPLGISVFHLVTNVSRPLHPSYLSLLTIDLPCPKEKLHLFYKISTGVTTNVPRLI